MKKAQQIIEDALTRKDLTIEGEEQDKRSLTEKWGITKAGLQALALIVKRPLVKVVILAVIALGDAVVQKIEENNDEM